MKGRETMEQYQVTGMSCAACSARVEKAVSSVEGVTSCSVSLLTNSMGVEGTADSSVIIKAVEDAGYGAKKKGAQTQSNSADADLLKDRETPVLKKRLITSVMFFDSFDVSVNGTYDVELADAEDFRWKPCSNGSDPVVIYSDHHGHQPEILY